jgi:transcriptional regulator with XRE-family HTH domain
MDRVALLQYYQKYNPATGERDCPRTNRDFARLIGVDESYLSKAYRGLHPVGVKALEGLRRAFPQEATKITDLFFGNAPGPDGETEPPRPFVPGRAATKIPA